MHTKHFILTGVLALAAFLIIVVGAYQLTPEMRDNSIPTVGEETGGTTPNADEEVEGKIKADVFTGTLEVVDTGCFADDECFIEVDGKHVTTIIGWSTDVAGTVEGVEGFGDLEEHIGQPVEVYAQVMADGTYTLYGSEGFYVKLINEVETPSADPIVTGGCMVGGCSGQLCGEAGDMEDMVTTCEYRAEYACYTEATCERQATGQCGWTDTEELRMCISAAVSVML